jgi:hypothetical protein
MTTIETETDPNPTRGVTASARVWLSAPGRKTIFAAACIENLVRDVITPIPPKRAA